MSRRVTSLRVLPWISLGLVVAWFVLFAVTHSFALLVGGLIAIAAGSALGSWLEKRLPSREWAQLQVERAHVRAHSSGSHTLSGEPVLLLSGSWFGPYEISDRAGEPVGRMTRSDVRSEAGKKLVRFDFVDADDRLEFAVETRHGPIRAQLGPFEFRVLGPDDANALTLRRRGISRRCEITSTTATTQIATMTANGWPSPNSTIRDDAGNRVARLSITSKGDPRVIVVEIEDHAPRELRIAALAGCLALDAIAPAANGGA